MGRAGGWLGRAGGRRWAGRLAVAAVFAAAVGVVLGPSLVGAKVALPHDLHLHHLPWSALPAAEDVAIANHELGDLVDTYYPTQHAIVARLLGGGDASWLGDVGFGFPGWEFVGWGAVSPFTLAPALVAPFDLAWSWGQGLRLLAAMTGAYLLARALGAGRPGGTAAGLAFGFSAFVVGWLGWPQSHVAAVLPWLWWATERAAGPDHRWWAAMALGLATAALWLGGFPALAVYGLLGAGLVALAAAARAERPWRRLAAAAAGVAAGTLAAAFTLVPSALLLSEMDLSARADAWQAQAFPIALWTFVAPRMFGGAGGIGPQVPHWIGQATVESTAYVGVVTLALAAAAWALAPRRRGVALHTAMALGFGALAYGAEPLVALIRLVPPLATNPPNRVLALVSLSAAVVGGLGVEAVRRALAGRARVARWGVAGATAVAAGCAAWGVERVAGGAVAGFAQRYLDDPAQLALARQWAVTSVAVAAALVAAAALIVAVGWWVLGHRAKRGRGPGAVGAAVAAALTLLVGVDVTAHAVGWNTQVPRAGLFPDAPGLDALRAADGRVAGTGRAGHPNTHLEHGFADLRGRGFLTATQRAALQRAGARFASPTHWTFDDAARGSWEPWLSVLGVHAMLTPAAGPDGPLPPGWRRARRGPVDVLTNPDARPPVAALTDVAITAAPLDHVGRRDPAGAAAQAALRPQAVASDAVPGGGAAEVTVLDRGGGAVTASVLSEDGAVMTTDQAALDGWHATVDGDAADVVAVDGLFAGVVVGPGRHSVTLAYTSPGRRAGRALTAVGVAGLIALGALGWRRRPGRRR